MKTSPLTADFAESAGSVAAAALPRQHRTRRLWSAWITLLPSKAITLLVQIVAMPMVYRAIGPVQFAAYAAVTSAVTILGFLNLGMGGAIVTPLSRAAADSDHEKESDLLAATLFPIGLISFAALCIALPLLWILPMSALFGVAAKTASEPALRTAALLACIGTLGAVPLSVIDSARQAYQEMHISNIFGTLTNAVLGVGLLLAAWLSPTLQVFVAVTALSPLLVRLVNGLLLFLSRPYLFGVFRAAKPKSLVGGLVKDGLSYMGAAAFANVLVYQWPVFYVARVRPPPESSSFAVYLQLILIASNFGVSLAQPLWPAVADAFARTDRAWIQKTARHARAAALIYGTCGLVLFGLAMNTILRLWLHRPVRVDSVACWLAGLYLFLTMWEYVHWPLILGLGQMRVASNLVFGRAVGFALLVPIVTPYGPTALMGLLCASIILVTGWRYPMLLSSATKIQ